MRSSFNVVHQYSLFAMLLIVSCASGAGGERKASSVSIELDGISAAQAIEVIHAFSLEKPVHAGEYLIGNWDAEDQRECNVSEEDFCDAEFYFIHVDRARCNPSYLVERACLKDERECGLIFHKSRSQLCD